MKHITTNLPTFSDKANLEGVDFVPVQVDVPAPVTDVPLAAHSGTMDVIKGDVVVRLDEPPRFYRRVKHSKGEPYDEEETHSRLSG